jgi:hypothetical protein
MSYFERPELLPSWLDVGMSRPFLENGRASAPGGGRHPASMHSPDTCSEARATANPNWRGSIHYPQDGS